MKLSFLFILFLTVPGITSCIKQAKDPNPGQVLELEEFVVGHKICLFGDSGKANQTQYAVAAALEAENCDEYIHTGDIIYGDGITDADDPNFFSKFYEPYRGIIERNLPIYMTVGNHDYKLKPEAWLDLAKKYEAIKFPSMYYFRTHGDVCFAMLDTNQYTSLAQSNWLKAVKSKYKDQCKMNIAIGHHPLYSAGEHGDATLPHALLLKNLIPNKFNAYFAGHDHNQSDEGIKDGVHHFVTGAAGESRGLSRKPRVWAQVAAGYMVIEMQRDANAKAFFNFKFYSVDINNNQTKLEHSGTIK